MEIGIEKGTTKMMKKIKYQFQTCRFTSMSLKRKSMVSSATGN